MAALVSRHCKLCELEPEEAHIVKEVLRMRRKMRGQGVIEIKMHQRGTQFFSVNREEHLQEQKNPLR